MRASLPTYTFHGVHKFHGTVPVGFEGTHPLEAAIVDDGKEQGVAEFTLDNLVHFAGEKILHLRERLTFLRHSYGDESPVIDAPVGEDVAREHFLALVEVEVYKTGHPVVKEVTDHVCNLAFGRAVAGRTPSEHDEFGFLAENIFHHRFRCRLFGLDLEGGEGRIGLPVTEIFLDDSHHLRRVKVAREADRDIVRDIIGVLVAPDGAQRRILQVVLRADDGLRAIGMVPEKHRIQGVQGLLLIVHEAHVLLLVHGLQLGVESAEYAVLEPVRFDPGPILDLIGGDVFGVAGHIVGSKRVASV